MVSIVRTRVFVIGKIRKGVIREQEGANVTVDLKEISVTNHAQHHSMERNVLMHASVKMVGIVIL